MKFYLVFQRVIHQIANRDAKSCVSWAANDWRRKILRLYMANIMNINTLFLSKSRNIIRA